MADDADMAKLFEDTFLDRRIAAARLPANPVLGGIGDCVDCNDPIPAARLLAAPNATRCLACQEDHEEMNR